MNFYVIININFQFSKKKLQGFIYIPAEGVKIMRYEINKNKCISCERCKNICPVGAIWGEIKEGFTIDQDKCIACGQCKEVCHFSAIIENM